MAATFSKSPSFLAPRKLVPGARLAVIAPSGPFDRNAFDEGVAFLRERYDVRYDEALFSRKGFLAGDDDRRARELIAALEDNAVDGIVAARGGYGAGRLLPRIDVRTIAAARKLLVGFSDITALHAAWARAGLRSIHGTMVGSFAKRSKEDRARWFSVLEGEIPPAIGGLSTVAHGVAEGPLLGGNLAVLASLVGTPYAPPLDGAILFLEDVGERPYRIDRMLTTLLHAGVIARAAAVALGAFTRSDPGDEATTAEEVLHERLHDASVPVIAGIPAGHIDDNIELPFGARARVDTTNGRLEFLEPATHESRDIDA